MKFSTLALLAGYFTVSLPLRAELTNPPLATASILESNVVYLRVNRVAAGLAEALAAATSALPATNKMVGTVLDLRFADGDDAAAAEKLFTAKKFPLAILVNSQTRGAAAALAKALREERAGLILGGAAAGVKPDIAVPVGADDERAYFADGYRDLAMTNAPVVAGMNPTNEGEIPWKRLSEADLVKARRAGAADPEETADSAPDVPEPPAKPVLRDPALVRAVDLLQGLALLRAKTGK